MAAAVLLLERGTDSLIMVCRTWPARRQVSNTAARGAKRRGPAAKIRFSAIADLPKRATSLYGPLGRTLPMTRACRTSAFACCSPKAAKALSANFDPLDAHGRFDLGRFERFGAY
jgi:hypothetical protein